jgi:hypothetical protein
MSSTIRLRGCHGCRHFPKVCNDPPARAALDCNRYENLGEWCDRQVVWLDKAERDWKLGLGMAGLIALTMIVLAMLA